MEDLVEKMISAEDKIFSGIGSRMKQVRYDAGLSRLECCEIFGLEELTLKKYEQGIRKVSIPLLAAYIEYFNVSADYLIMGRKKINKNEQILKNHAMEDSVLYSVKDLMAMGIKQHTAYRLMHSSGFPTLRVNGRMYVRKNAYDKWVARNEGKLFNT